MNRFAILVILVAVAACESNAMGPPEPPVSEPGPEPPAVEPPDLGPVQSIRIGPYDTLYVASDSIDLRVHVLFGLDAEGDTIPAASAIAQLDPDVIGWDPTDGLDPYAGHSGATGNGWLVPMPDDLATYLEDDRGYWRLCVEVWLNGDPSGGIYASVIPIE